MSGLLRPSVRVVGGSLVGGVVLAAAGGSGEQTVPTGAYVVLVAALVSAEVLRALTRHSPPDLDPMPSLLARREGPPTRRPVTLLGWEALVESALLNGRAVRVRLHPRLRDLAARRLSSSAGIDLDASPTRAAAVLGPDVWAFVQRPPGPVPDPQEPGADPAQLERAIASLEALDD